MRLTEYGDVLMDGLDEWGHHRVDGLMDEGEMVYVAEVVSVARRMAVIG